MGKCMMSSATGFPLNVHARASLVQGQRRQRGVVLILALIVLVAMTLASIAMVRSVDTSTIVAGNLAFRQSGVAAGDAGAEAAIAWLSKNPALLTKDSPPNGYYATGQDCLDLTGSGRFPAECTPPHAILDWNNADMVKTLAEDAAGNKIFYVIHRMCDSEGPVDGATCATDQSSLSEGRSKGIATAEKHYGDIKMAAINRVYYRITVRIAGPRNATSQIQTVVSLPV
jgi:type IV pilus assembly protein PilX